VTTADEECNGWCLTPADIGLPEYGGRGVIAYAHPDCPEHGDPQEEYEDIDVCDAWSDEGLRYVREEDVAV
jgi:hypothetical protein